MENENIPIFCGFDCLRYICKSVQQRKIGFGWIVGCDDLEQNFFGYIVLWNIFWK